MKKSHVILALIGSLILLAGASHARAQVTPMSDSELAGITGQAGFAPLGGYAGFQRDAASNHVYFGGNGAALGISQPAYQMEKTGQVSAIVMSEDGSSFSFEIKNPGFTMRNYRTSLRLGNHLSGGASLGTVSVGLIRVTTHGTIRITVR